MICRISFPIGRTITCPGVGFLPCFIGSKLYCKNESFDAYLLPWSNFGTIKRPLVPCSFRMASSTGGHLPFWIHVLSYGSKRTLYGKKHIQREENPTTCGLSSPNLAKTIVTYTLPNRWTKNSFCRWLNSLFRPTHECQHPICSPIIATGMRQ